MSAIGENIARIRAEIDAAARETGRTGKDITLVGASKMNDAAACQEAIAAGIDALGENRVQEMTEKLKENAYDGAPLHFIQSVGSKELLDEIEKVAARMELVQDVLLEVNIGGEEAKSGFAPEELPQAAAYAKGLAHIRVRGLMTIPPVAVEKGGNIPYFEKVHRLFVDISREMYDNKWEYISMGMSGDYADAVRCGANMVRVGSAIFGARNYQK